jgi:hypothetical protein
VQVEIGQMGVGSAGVGMSGLQGVVSLVIGNQAIDFQAQ